MRKNHKQTLDAPIWAESNNHVSAACKLQLMSHEYACGRREQRTERLVKHGGGDFGVNSRKRVVHQHK
jgi:hypothetical protein